MTENPKVRHAEEKLKEREEEKEKALLMVNSKTPMETVAGPKANIVPLTVRMQMPLTIHSSKGANTAVKRCFMMIIGPTGEEAAGTEVESRGLEAGIVISRGVSPATAEADDKVVAKRWVSARAAEVGDMDAVLTVPMDTAGVNMAITVDLDVGETIGNGNRLMIANMQKGK